jgi:hypothetical protein
MSNHAVLLIGGGDDDETANLTEMPSPNSCRLVCDDRGKLIQAEAADFFEALCMVPHTLEQGGLSTSGVCSGEAGRGESAEGRKLLLDHRTQKR